MNPRQPRPGARSRTRRLFGLLGGFCVVATLAASVTTVAGLGIVQARGAQVMVVASGSMEPTFRAGDAVVVEPLRRRALVPGTVITYHAPGEPEQLTTHRILERRELPDGLYLQTQGDANATPDPDFVPAGSVVGIMSTSVPVVGYWLAFYQTPTGRLVVLGAPLALLIASQLRATLAELRRRPAVGRVRGPQVAAAVVVVVSLATGTLVARCTAALFTRQAPVAGNTFSTAATFCDDSTTYDAVVLADKPLFHHRFSETIGTTAATTVGTSTGTYTGRYALGVAGATVCETGSRAVRLDGSTGHVVRSSSAALAPNDPFSVEIWFRTTTAGGKLIGFGDERVNASKNHLADRHLYLSDSGALYFGVESRLKYVVSSGATTYTDGQWHHAVGTLGASGMALYVDGNLVAFDRAVTSAGSSVDGYWRIGFDSLFRWPDAPTNEWYSGDLDEAAVYPTALGAKQVATHYAEGRR